MNEPLAEMFHYNKWAMAQVLEACSALTGEQLVSKVPASEWAVAHTLVHVVGSQDVFVLRLTGQDQAEARKLWPEGEWPGFERLRTAADKSSDELIRIAEATEKDEFVRQGFEYEGQRWEISKSFLLTHALVHGVEHREQLLTALGTLGLSVPDLDGWAYSQTRPLMRPVE